MAFWQRVERPGAMASRWRRRRLCEVCAGGIRQVAALRDVSGHGALLETANPSALGCRVELLHPEAGTIAGRVSEIGEGRFRMSFDGQEAAIAFALGAIAADMTRRR